MAKRKKQVKKVVKERIPIAPPTKTIPDRRKEAEKKICRKKLDPPPSDDETT